MDIIEWLNIVLWTFDFLLLGTVSLVYLWFAKFYHHWEVLEINSGHDIINSSTFEQILGQFKKQFRLETYEIIFSNDKYENRLFWNLHPRQKKVLLTKRLFPSVGYELDYLISRLWLAAKELENNRLIKLYKMCVKYLSHFYLISMGVAFVFESLFVFLGMQYSEIWSPFWTFLWQTPIIALLVITFFVLWLFNIYYAMHLKKNIEFLYDQEVVPFVKNFLDYYAFDFLAARQYAQAIKLPYAFIFKNKLDKWLGPFVY